MRCVLEKFWTELKWNPDVDHPVTVLLSFMLILWGVPVTDLISNESTLWGCGIKIWLFVMIVNVTLDFKHPWYLSSVSQFVRWPPTSVVLFSPWITTDSCSDSCWTERLFCNRRTAQTWSQREALGSVYFSIYWNVLASGPLWKKKSL